MMESELDNKFIRKIVIKNIEFELNIDSKAAIDLLNSGSAIALSIQMTTINTFITLKQLNYNIIKIK
jgi:hypothetical protein